MPVSKISNALHNDSFVAAFMHLKSKGGCKEYCMEVGESKVAIGLQVNKILCSPRVITVYFKGVLT